MVRMISENCLRVMCGAVGGRLKRICIRSLVSTGLVSMYSHRKCPTDVRVGSVMELYSKAICWWSACCRNSFAW